MRSRAGAIGFYSIGEAVGGGVREELEVFVKVRVGIMYVDGCKEL